MEKRTIEITIDTAKEWYLSNNETLKRLSLQAFSKEELKEKEFEKIKTFEDALEQLGISQGVNELYIETLDKLPNSKHLIAIYKLDIIRKALNGSDFRPSYTHGPLIYPIILYFSEYRAAYEYVTMNSNHSICGAVTVYVSGSNRTYYMVGGSYSVEPGAIINDDRKFYKIGGVQILSCCESEAVAEHMSKYFANEIFEATNAQYGDYILAQ
jgi:hypothetical protein